MEHENKGNSKADDSSVVKIDKIVTEHVALNKAMAAMFNNKPASKIATNKKKK